MTPPTLTKIRQYLQSKNGGFVFVFVFFVFLPHSPVVSHAMNNLDLSIMENWLTAFMVRFLALFVLLLCFSRIFSRLRKNSFLLGKLVIGRITYKSLHQGRVVQSRVKITQG